MPAATRRSERSSRSSRRKRHLRAPAGLIASLVFLLFTASLAMAGALPEVWERRIDTPGFDKPFLELLPMQDGDVAIASGERATAFFSGRALARAGSEIGVEPPAAQPYSTTLRDGRHLRRIGPPGCVRRPGVTIALTDSTQHIEQEYAWIWIPEQPMTLTAAECALTEMAPLSQRAVILDPKVLALADGGFLLGDARTGLVIRFDASYQTRSRLLDSRLLRMPAAEMKAMVAAHASAADGGGYDWPAFQTALEQWVAAQRGERRQP
jgi:hypothetical protein